MKIKKKNVFLAIGLCATVLISGFTLYKHFENMEEAKLNEQAASLSQLDLDKYSNDIKNFQKKLGISADVLKDEEVFKELKKVIIASATQNTPIRFETFEKGLISTSDRSIIFDSENHKLRFVNKDLDQPNFVDFELDDKNQAIKKKTVENLFADGKKVGIKIVENSPYSVSTMEDLASFDKPSDKNIIYCSQTSVGDETSHSARIYDPKENVDISSLYTTSKNGAEHSFEVKLYDDKGIETYQHSDSTSPQMYGKYLKYINSGNEKVINETCRHFYEEEFGTIGVYDDLIGPSEDESSIIESSDVSVKNVDPSFKGFSILENPTVIGTLTKDGKTYEVVSEPVFTKV